MNVINPAFSSSLPDDVKECVRKHRTFAEIAQGLSDDHAEHVTNIAAIDAQFDAWSTRLDAAIKQWEASRG